MEHAQAQLRRLGRQVARRTGPDRRTGQQPSARWRKTQARIARAHARAANLREDGLHRLTTRLSARYGTIVVEDLYVTGMIRNRRLARRISDAGFGALRAQLGYKTTWHGGQLIIADRFYPSSKTCSGCGAVKAKLRLSERTYKCEKCGLVIDRDLNAARNLAALADIVLPESRGDGKRARWKPGRDPRRGYRVPPREDHPASGAASARAARHGLPTSEKNTKAH